MITLMPSLQLLLVLQFNKVMNFGKSLPKCLTHISGFRFKSFLFGHKLHDGLGHWSIDWFDIFFSDFIDYLPLERVMLKDIAWTNNFLGIGTVMWKLTNSQGNSVYIPEVAYHMPQCDILLFSPQNYFKVHRGDAIVTSQAVTQNLPGSENHEVVILINPSSNLPTILHPQPILKEK